MEDKKESRADEPVEEVQVVAEEHQENLQTVKYGYEKPSDSRARYAFLSSVFRKAISKSFSDLTNSNSDDEFFTQDLVSLVKIAKGKGIPVSISEVMQNEIIKIQNEDTDNIEIETTIECQRKIATNSDSYDDLIVDEFEELRKSRYFIQRCIRTLKEIEAGLVWRALPENEDVGLSVVNKHIKTKVFIDAFIKDHLNPYILQFEEIPPKTSEEQRARASLHFTGLYRTAHRALLACKKHLPTAFGNSCYQQMNILLEYLFQTCNINMRYINIDFNINNEVDVNDLKINCAKMLHIIDQRYLTPPIEKKKPKPQPKKIKRRPMQIKKPDVPSRYMTATFKHRPPVEKHQLKIEKKEQTPAVKSTIQGKMNPSQCSSAVSMNSAISINSTDDKDNKSEDGKKIEVAKEASMSRPKAKVMKGNGNVRAKVEKPLRKLKPLPPALEKELLEQKIALKKLQKKHYSCFKNLIKPLDSIDETPDETDDSEFVLGDSLTSLD